MRKTIIPNQALILNLITLATILSSSLGQTLSPTRTPYVSASPSRISNFSPADPEKGKREIIFGVTAGVAAAVIIVLIVMCLLKERRDLNRDTGPRLAIPVPRPPSPPRPSSSIFTSSRPPSPVMTRKEAMANLPHWRTKGVGGETADAYEEDVKKMMKYGHL